MPAIIAFVVAIAGIILPAIARDETKISMKIKIEQ